MSKCQKVGMVFDSIRDCSSTLAWKIHGAAKRRTLLHDFTFTFPFVHWRRKWQPTPVFLPGESQGQMSLVGCSIGSHRVGHDWSDLAASENIPAANIQYHQCCWYQWWHGVIGCWKCPANSEKSGIFTDIVARKCIPFAHFLTLFTLWNWYSRSMKLVAIHMPCSSRKVCSGKNKLGLFLVSTLGKQDLEGRKYSIIIYVFKKFLEARKYCKKPPYNYFSFHWFSLIRNSSTDHSTCTLFIHFLFSCHLQARLDFMVHISINSLRVYWIPLSH